MTAAKISLPQIEKGATYQHTILWKDKLNVAIDLTGCTAKMQVRTTVDAADPPLIELSTANNRITIIPDLGQLNLDIHSDDTTTLVGEGGVYDLEIYFPSGKIVRLLEGKIKFTDEVTRG